MIILFYYRYISFMWKVLKYSHIKIALLYYFNYYVINIYYHLWFFSFLLNTVLFIVEYEFIIFWFHSIWKFLQYLLSVNIFISVKSKKFLMKGIKIFYDIMLQWHFPTTFQKSFKMYKIRIFMRTRMSNFETRPSLKHGK